MNPRIIAAISTLLLVAAGFIGIRAGRAHDDAGLFVGLIVGALAIAGLTLALIIANQARE